MINPFAAKRLGPALSALAILTLAAPTASHAAVSLLFSTAQAQAAPGGSFTFTLSLNATAGEQTTGVDYYLANAGSGFFTIAARSLSGSAYPDVYFADVTGQNLTPRTMNDLGGVTTDQNAPVSGTEQVATYTLAIAANAVPGTYTIATTSLDGTGWVDQSFNDNPFDSQASLTVTVVPEPGAAALLMATGAAVAGGVFRRQRRGSR